MALSREASAFTDRLRFLCGRVLISTQMPSAEVLEADNPVQALAQIQECVFDLVLLGLDLSDSVTVDTLKAAREASPATRFALRCLVKLYRAVERYWRRMLRSRSWAGRRLT